MHSSVPDAPNASFDIALSSPHSGADWDFLCGRRAWFAALVALMCLAAFLRLWRLDENPRWYVDEGIYTAIARTWAEEGVPRCGALRWPFAREYVTKPPLWFILNAPLQALLPGPVMFKARLPSAFTAIAMVWILASIGRRIHSPAAGIFAACLSLIHLPMMRYGRWATPYPLSGLLSALAVWALVAAEDSPSRPFERRIEAAAAKPPPGRGLFLLSYIREPYFMAACAAGLAFVADFFAIQTIGFVLLWAVLRRKWRKLPVMAAAAFAPFLIFAAWGFSRRGVDFAREMASLFFQFGGESTGKALFQMAYAARIIFTRDWIVPAGLVGLAAMAWRGKGRVPALFLLCMMPLILRRQGGDAEIPHNMPAYLFAIHLGFAALWMDIAAWPARWLAKRAPGARGGGAMDRKTSAEQWLKLAIGAAPLVAMTATAALWTCTEIPLGAKALASVRDVEAARLVAGEINERFPAEAIVVVPETLLPLIQCRAATADQVRVAEGEFVKWHRFVDPGRDFVFSPKIESVRVVVVDEWMRFCGLRPWDPNCPHPMAILMRNQPWRARTIGEYGICSRMHEPEDAPGAQP